MKSVRQVKAVSSIDDRYLPRWETHKKVLCSVNGGRACRCETRDIHCSGIHLKSKRELPSEKTIRMQIHLSEEVNIGTDGHIVWSHPVEDGFEYGILFDKITQKAVDQIFKQAFEVKEKPA